MVSRQSFTIILVSLVLLVILVEFFRRKLINDRRDEGPVGCPQGFCAYNPLNTSCNSVPEPNTETICMSATRCNLVSFPCVGTQRNGALCPGQDGYSATYNGSAGDYCTDVSICPNWAAPLHFTQISSNIIGQNKGHVMGYFSQIGDKSCSLNDEARKFVVPSACMEGEWTLNERDSRWYCVQHSLPCEAILELDGTLRCKEE